MQEPSIENKITEMQNKYYTINQKSRIFPNQQKFDCASLITQSFNKTTLFSQSVYIVSNTNHIFIDYPKFKTFGCPEIYEEYIAYILQLIDECLAKYTTYEIHVNMQSFTATAAQRYKEMIYILINTCLSQNTGISFKVTAIYLYNAAKMIDAIMHLFSGLVNDDVKYKIHIVNNSST